LASFAPVTGGGFAAVLPAAHRRSISPQPSAPGDVRTSTGLATTSPRMGRAMSDIRPKLNSWLGREASRRRDRGDDTDGLRVARDLRDLITYIEGCEAKDELLVRI
jgi:hypothetical protein